MGVCFLFLADTVNAQVINETLSRQLVPYKPNVNIQKGNNSRAVSCGTDTILYPWFKETYFTAPNDSFFLDAMVGSVRTASQAYLNNDTVMVKGVQFWGAAYSTGTLPQTLVTKAYLYNVDVANMPTTIIDSALVTINENYDFYEAMFAVPVQVTGNFAVAVKNQVNDTLAVVTNNAGNVWSTDYSESLAWRRFGSGSWNSAQSFFGQDLEYMIFPIVEYDIDVNFTTTSNDTICEGDSVIFTNTSSPIMQNRMFNLYEFYEYWSPATDTTFIWVYGDGDWGRTFNGGNTYNTAGTYTPKVWGTQLGYYTWCLDSAWMTIEVMEDVNAAFGIDNSSEPTFVFTNNSSGGMSYFWDFGDGNTATTQNASHTYTANGTYDVKMIVNGFCGADTVTQQVTVTGISVAKNQSNLIRSFYVASERSLVVETANSGTVQVFDMVGKAVLNVNISAKQNRINLANLPEGTYITRITSGDTSSTNKFVLIK